jgi:hypothetical protein
LAKLANVFETLTFNIIMSIVALAMLTKYLIAMVTAGSFAPAGLLFIVWIVIAYHFVRASIAALKERRR